MHFPKLFRIKRENIQCGIANMYGEESKGHLIMMSFD